MESKKLMYPLSRYWYSDGFRYYYAYGNTPAQDFLQNCSGTKEPSVLVLGCGDIRSCFYSLWKNFDIKSGLMFDGVNFILNDISAAVLARNVLFVYLCLQIPEEESKAKKWLSSMWAIWYCHELYPDHDKLLHDSLNALCKYSEDWSRGSNPLHPMVKFTSPATLCEIHKVWKMWLEYDVDISSIRDMHEARQKEFLIHGQFFKDEEDVSDFVLGSTEIPYETFDNPEKFKAQKSEVLAYCKSGSTYAENVFEMNLPSSPSLVNFTLFERDDGKYSLHYRSMPFSCYYQTVEFSSKQLRYLTIPGQVTVKDEHFKLLPYLANSVQQFSLWLQSARKVLTSAKYKQNINFTLDCSHALSLCCGLTESKKIPKYDLIYTSNLMDHVSAPNLVLSAVPLLKENGHLFTTTLMRDPLSVFSDYLSECFGFDSKLFTILFGVRCINYEGYGYASPVSVRPSPCTLRDIACSHYEKLQVWEKLPFGTLPLIFDSSQPLSHSITEALLGCVKASVYPLLKPTGIIAKTYLCVETAVRVLQTFMVNCFADFTPYFWKPLSDAMQAAVKPYLHSIQTQLLLHDVHMHLTVSGDDCPICLQMPVSSSIGLFCVRVPVQIDFHTPKFFCAVHKEESDEAEYLCNIAREGGHVHLFDCVSTSADNSEVIELYFHAPRKFSEQGYKVALLVASTVTTGCITNMPNVPTQQLSRWLIADSIFQFNHPPLLPSSQRFKPGSSFGTIVSHMSEGDASEVTIHLLERAVTASRSKELHLKKISLNVVKVSFGKIACTIKFPYPVDFDNINTKFSRRERRVILRCPRALQQFENEKPLFVIDPERQFSHSMSACALEGLSGQQFMKADRIIHKSCKGDFSEAPPLISLKNTLMIFFQQKSTCYYQFLLPRSGVHMMVLVNRRLYDYENRLPVLDLAFCCLDESFVHTVVPIWMNISSGQSFNIHVSDAQYKLMKEVFHYFAERTAGTCSTVLDPKGLLCLLTKHGIQRYFTRAVIYLLLYSPDSYRHFMVSLSEGSRQVGDQPTGSFRDKEDSKCDNCGDFFEVTKKCSACKLVKYCGGDCQQKHWKVHKHHCKKDRSVKLVVQQPKSSLPVFPLARYTYYGDFKFYYAYGNTPAEDLLQSCAGERKPSILSLGCGDIRSCFYTLWKHFDSTISDAPKQFNRVQFILNDCSSPVLARNIVFILLCIQLPERVKERKTWLSAMWAVWYCHELFPRHQEILDDCLRLLLTCSESLDSWVHADNPVRNLIRFTSPAVLTEISLIWKAWLTRAEGLSVKQMHNSRLKELKRYGILDNIDYHATLFAHSSVVNIAGDNSGSAATKVIPEVKFYVHTGSCHAEDVFGIGSDASPTTVNLTLFERPAGVYSLHYCSLPFQCYYHTVEFSPDALKHAGVEYGGLLVPSRNFISNPLLANSVQQFSMWTQSASTVLNDKNTDITFTFNNQHALTFCHELQDMPSGNQFSVIFSSNLMDHLGPSNLVLSALPLLKPDGLLFTATLHYKGLSNTIEEFLTKCFGFDSKFFPVILGTRCINHEGAEYASPVMVQPLPVLLDHFNKIIQQQRVLIWENVTTQPTLVSKGVPHIPTSITDTICDSIVELSFSLMRSNGGLQVLNNSNVETAVLMLQKFYSSVWSEDHHVWELLCRSLKARAKPFLNGLQTQALLHDLHIHLTVDESTCHKCRHIPLNECIGLFCTEVPCPLPPNFKTPCFMAFIHKHSTSDSHFLYGEAQSSGDVHIIDSIDGTMSNKTLKLKFFAPLYFVKEHFKVTIAITTMSPLGRNIIKTILPTSNIKDCQIKFEYYRFSQGITALHKTISSNFGKLIYNVCYEDYVESEIIVSDSAVKSLALNSSGLSTNMISSSEIQLLCGVFQFNLRFQFPISYDLVSIKLSRVNKTIKIISPRRVQSFYEEKPFFIACPDHQLSLPPLELDTCIIDNHFAMQMTPEEKVIMETHSNRDSMTPLTKVKETLNHLFQKKGKFYFQLTTYDQKVLLGMVIVNKRVFDYQNNAPAIDLAFYFCDINMHSVNDVWINITQKIVTNIFVDDAEYQELQEMVIYMAKRTNGDLKSAGKNSRYQDLFDYGVDKYFTRAVFYHLYCDPDQKALSVKLDKFSPNSDAVSKTSGDRRTKNPDTICSFCCKTGTLKKCLRCGEAQYCNKDCQAKHWARHKAECRRFTSTLKQETSSATPASLASSSEAVMCCACCGISSMDLRLCTGCGKVKYCGTECQRKDWKNHKSTCK
jgi:2-polyprenyl-3-methyl-5-hydroxy-6-metoxy-1,4-benzoquinol methylase